VATQNLVFLTSEHPVLVVLKNTSLQNYREKPCIDVTIGAVQRFTISTQRASALMSADELITIATEDLELRNQLSALAPRYTFSER
jgi:hypothetical protein